MHSVAFLLAGERGLGRYYQIVHLSNIIWTQTVLAKKEILVKQKSTTAMHIRQRFL